MQLFNSSPSTCVFAHVCMLCPTTSTTRLKCIGWALDLHQRSCVVGRETCHHQYPVSGISLQARRRAKVQVVDGTGEGVAFYIHIESLTNRGGIVAHMHTSPQLAQPMLVHACRCVARVVHACGYMNNVRCVPPASLFDISSSCSHTAWLAMVGSDRLSKKNVQLETDESDHATKSEFSHRKLESDSVRESGGDASVAWHAPPVVRGQWS
jgi:hypothetical protein